MKRRASITFLYYLIYCRLAVCASLLLLVEFPSAGLAFDSTSKARKTFGRKDRPERYWQPKIRLQPASSALFASNPLEEEIASWAKDAGYGEVESCVNSGRSGWASFYKVHVSHPPKPNMAFFVKHAKSRQAHEMFDGEALGLKAMYECSSHTTVQDGVDDIRDDQGTSSTSSIASLKIPQVFYSGDVESSEGSSSGSLLIMEFLFLGPRRDDYAFGQAMANLHLANPVDTAPKAGNPFGKFGFPLDNTIGGTPQPNPWTHCGETKDWIEFYGTHRILHQLELAEDEYLIQLWKEDIAPRLDRLFEGIQVKPSLLHGDLWSGNIGSVRILEGDGDGSKPTIYDPACYWGHHEAEWGMSWCASLGSTFWEGYRSILPEDEGFWDRKPLYDAYHQLNHYNLFSSSGYLNKARRQLETVKKALDEKKE
ncbi:unnamed protein product [Cylindrotheca closterium]|uniref:protein-ribulosamine 3-kinase n=1 Tax=Cylindrotheca closterium TaxID=2856 RepID=A0AAD2G8T9_9STRA|nr:unnamed protein product [Cylindrotheca closterium]